MTLRARPIACAFRHEPNVALLSHSNFAAADTPHRPARMRQVLAVCATRDPTLRGRGQNASDRPVLEEDPSANLFPTRFQGPAICGCMSELRCAANITPHALQVWARAPSRRPPIRRVSRGRGATSSTPSITVGGSLNRTGGRRLTKHRFFLSRRRPIGDRRREPARASLF